MVGDVTCDRVMNAPTLGDSAGNYRDVRSGFA